MTLIVVRTVLFFLALWSTAAVFADLVKIAIAFKTNGRAAFNCTWMIIAWTAFYAACQF